MKLKLVFSILSFLFFLPFSDGFGQVPESLKEAWAAFKTGDDNEKDFQFNSFLTILEETVQSNFDNLEKENFLAGWRKTSDEEGRYTTFVTYLDFELKPDRLIYCVYSSDRGEAVVRYKEIHEEYDDLDLSLNMKTGDGLTGLIVSHKNESLLRLPDLETLFLLNDLLLSRGRSVVFSISDRLLTRIELLLQNPQLFLNDFSDYQGLSTIVSSDDKLKIITWNVEEMNGDHHFYGLVGVRMEDVVKIFMLQDKRDEIRSPEYATLRPEKWFGAVYYEMIVEKYRGEMFYTLLGYNGNDAFSRLRIVDVITLSPYGRPRFGALMFDDHGRTKRRLIYEYSNRANMMLRYDERDERIVMDHLAPLDPMYEGDPSYYGPDFSYDVLEMDKGKWVLEKNVDLRNR